MRVNNIVMSLLFVLCIMLSIPAEAQPKVKPVKQLKINRLKTITRRNDMKAGSHTGRRRDWPLVSWLNSVTNLHSQHTHRVPHVTRFIKEIKSQNRVFSGVTTNTHDNEALLIHTNISDIENGGYINEHDRPIQLLEKSLDEDMIKKMDQLFKNGIYFDFEMEKDTIGFIIYTYEYEYKLDTA